MDRGHGQRRPTKSTRGKWVAIESDTESADTIKVRIQINLNQRSVVFMNIQILQHRRDKVI